MNYETILDENNELKQKIILLQIELEQIKEHLKQYTAPLRSKKYYENNKHEIKQRVKEYKQTKNYIYTPSLEKKKEYARTAYLNKKAKMQKLQEIII
jgi:hypothetical protein